MGIEERQLGIHRLLRWRLPVAPAPEPAAVGAAAAAEGGDDA